MGIDVKNTTCDEALSLLSRNLDNDLSKAEVIELYRHVAGCPECRSRMEEITVQEEALTRLNALYETLSLDRDFSERVMEGIRGAEPTPEAPERDDGGGDWTRFFKGLLEGPVLVSRALWAATGAVAACLIFLLWPGAVTELEHVPRFHMHGVRFSSASDTMDWHHRYTIAPGESVQFVVRKGHEQDYHFKFESDAPVSIEIVHRDPDVKRDAVHALTVHGVHFGYLKRPKPMDVIIVLNKGDHPVRVSAHTVERKNVTVEHKGKTA